ncbi:MAG: hypothetical protein PHD48_01260 [Alphaproteobacteria bacterium]|nr:hypothetical protein [Alphaproteobacteria bacterium]
MTKVQSLFDEPYQTLQRQRRGYCDPSTHPLYREAQARLDERRADVKREFNHSLVWPLTTPLQPHHCKAPMGRRGNPSHNNEYCHSPSIKEMKCQTAQSGQARNDGRACEPFDLITSCLTLQNANGLQDELAAIYASLTQGGLFLGVLAGGQTLSELRTCFIEAEIGLSGGASPRLPPLPDAETMSRLLPSTGFSLPVVDKERVILTYPDLHALMRDLRRHGCTNSLSERPRHFTNRNLFEVAREIYATRFPAPSGGIVVTVDLIFLHGWRE